MENYEKMHELQKQIHNSSMGGGSGGSYKKRERTQNWAHQEKKFLLELCKKDMRIIENKRLDAGLTAIKNKAWKIIHQKFSAAFGTDRTCNRLKEQWRRMKACTRNEIMDYNNRVFRFGQQIADRKRPSPFTFEVWEFMQESKRICKNEALDGVDYSKVPLALEESLDTNGDITHINDDKLNNKNDNTSGTHIKEESNSDNEGAESIDRVSTPHSNGSNYDVINGQQINHHNLNNTENDLSTTNLTTSFPFNNIAATFETLNAIRNFSLQNTLQHNNNHHHDQQPPSKRSRQSASTIDTDLNINFKEFMDMQVKEHMLRMQILETQLQTAKFNRDIMEINKTIALQKLHDIANRRLS